MRTAADKPNDTVFEHSGVIRVIWDLSMIHDGIAASLMCILPSHNYILTK